MIQERVELGPIHTWLPGPMKIRLGMSGDRMVSTEPVFGFSSRAIEANMAGRTVEHAQFLFSKMEPESALLLDRLYSEAVEQLCEVEVSERTTWIREITSDLNELNLNLKFLAKMASRLGVRILYHSILKHRESLLDLLELLSGSRYGYFYLVPGGVRYDLTAGFQERLETWIGDLVADWPRIEELFCWTHGFQNRLRTMGLVVDGGDYGFVSRAAVDHTRFGQISHVESRLKYVLSGCGRLCDSVRAKLSDRPEGSVRTALPKRLKSGAALESELATERGAWSVELTADPHLLVTEVRVRAPSDRILESIQPALQGESLEDLPLILESLFLSVAEIDR